jgi:hypothetical protein
VNLRIVIRAVYSLLGMLYVLAGVGAMVLPLGWVSPSWAGPEAIAPYAAAAPESYLNHLTQEFGTLAIAVGFVFLWQARRAEPSRSLHWLLTLYLMLDASIHWVGPQGLIGSLQRGVTNSIPPLLFLILGLLWRRADSDVEGGLQTALRRRV